MDLDKDVLRIVTSLGQEEKHFSLFLYRAQNLPSLLFYLQKLIWILLLEIPWKYHMADIQQTHQIRSL